MASNLPQSPLNAFLSSLPGYAMNLQQMARQSQEQQAARQFQGQQARMNREAQYKQFSEQLAQQETQFGDQLDQNYELKDRALVLDEKTMEMNEFDRNLLKAKAALSGEFGREREYLVGEDLFDALRYEEPGAKPTYDQNFLAPLQESSYDVDQRFVDRVTESGRLAEVVKEFGLEGQEALLTQGLLNEDQFKDVMYSRGQNALRSAQGDIAQFISEQGLEGDAATGFIDDFYSMMGDKSIQGVASTGFTPDYVPAPGANIQRIWDAMQQQQAPQQEQQVGQPNMEMYNQYKGYRGID